MSDHKFSMLKTPTAEEFHAAVAALTPDLDATYESWLPALRQADILDFGSGSGVLIEYLHRKGFANVVGLEPDMALAEFSRQVTLAPIESTEGREFLRAHSGKFDAIFCRHVVYYFAADDLHEWFRLLARALKPGGLLCVEVFNGAVASASFTARNDPFIKTVFTETLLCDMLEMAELKILFIGAEKYASRGLRRQLWFFARALWGMGLRLTYLIERGLDARNPKSFGKNVVAMARKESPTARSATRLRE